MTKLNVPLLSFSATGTLGQQFALAKRLGQHILQRKPSPTDAKSSSQLFFRTLYQQCTALWHTLSQAEKAIWESNARPFHMTGYAYYISQCLRPNPGIYLPLAGGTMQGIIDMDANRITNLPAPVDNNDPARKIDLPPPGVDHLDDIGDVHVPSPSDNDLLYWDDSDALWKARALIDDDIPASICRDAEADSKVATHSTLDTGIHGVGASYIPLAPAAAHLIRAFTKGWTSAKYLLGTGINSDPSEVDTLPPSLQRACGSVSITNTEADIVTLTPTRLPAFIIVLANVPASSSGKTLTVKVTDNNNTILTTGSGVEADEDPSVAAAFQSLSLAASSFYEGIFVFIAIVSIGTATPTKVRGRSNDTSARTFRD